MDNIHKLPFISGAVMTIIIGLISFKYDRGSQSTYIKMAVTMIVFYLLGLYIKNVIIKFAQEIGEKKEQEAKEAIATARRKKIAEKYNEKMTENEVNRTKIDYKIDDNS